MSYILQSTFHFGYFASDAFSEIVKWTAVASAATKFEFLSDAMEAKDSLPMPTRVLDLDTASKRN